jgi:hypothetical protein
LRTNRGIERLLHRAVPVHHLVAEDAADVRLHHAAEPVVAAAKVEPDVVDRVLEPLEVIPRIARAFEQRRELYPADVIVGGGRDGAHLVPRTIAELADHHGIEREIRKEALADVAAAPGGRLEVRLRNRQIRDDDLRGHPSKRQISRLNTTVRSHSTALVQEHGIEQRRQQVVLPAPQKADLPQPPWTRRVARRHLRVDERLGAVPERQVGKVLQRAFEPDDERDHIVAQREDGAGVHRVFLDDAPHVRERDADVGVEEMTHGHAPVRADLDARLRDDAELAVAEEHALEVVVAFVHRHDLAGRRHHLELDGLVRGAAVARRIHVDAADAERAADGREHVERRAGVVEAERPQRFRHLVPRHAGLDPRGGAVAVEQPVHALHIEKDASGGDRLAFGRQAAAAARDRDVVALRDPQKVGNVLRGAGVHHRVGHPVHDLAAVGAVAGARGAIGPEEHARDCTCRQHDV